MSIRTVDFDPKQFTCDAYGNLYPKIKIRKGETVKIRVLSSFFISPIGKK